MRIAIVGNFGLGSKQTMAVRALPLAEELARRGHAVQMALPIRWDADLSEPDLANGVALRYAGRGPHLPGLTQLWQLLLLAWYTLRWRPDVVYCFKPIAYSGAILVLFRWLRLARLFRGTIALDTDDWEGDGGWNDRFALPRWVKRLVAWQEQWSLRHADVTTVASRTLQELVQQVGARKTVYLPNALAQSSLGLPAIHSTDSELGLDDRPVVLLYTRFVEFDVTRVLDVLENLCEDVGNAVLLVVGQGLRGEEQELSRMALARGLVANVRLAGWIPTDLLPHYFAMAHVALYLLDDTLLNRAKCPMKLLDLLAAGVPVVADRVGQAYEYVADGRSGLLVEPGNRTAMAEAVASLLSDPERLRAMGEAARADARSRWSWAAWAPVAEAALTASPTTRSESALPATRTPGRQ